MGDREQVEEAVQLLFAAHGQQLVHLPDVSALRREPLVHIQDESLQKVHLRIVPEPVTFRGACVPDDDVAEELRHDLLPFNLRQAVPAVGILRVDQVEHLYGVAVVFKIEAQVCVELGFRVGDNEALPPLHALEHHVPCVGTALHAAAGPEHGHVAVHPRPLRQADRLSVQLPQDDAPVPRDVRDQLQHLAHLRIRHEAGGAVGPLVRIGQVPLPVIGALPPEPHAHHHEYQQAGDACAQGDPVQAVREDGERLKAGGRRALRECRGGAVPGVPPDEAQAW